LLLKIAKLLRKLGVKSNSGESAARTLEAGHVEGIQEYMQMRAETVYASSKREPLGHTYNRGHILPECTKKKDFQGFGIDLSEDYDSIDAKYLLFPRDRAPDSKEVENKIFAQCCSRRRSAALFRPPTEAEPCFQYLKSNLKF
jgi:hypothetical protein